MMNLNQYQNEMIHQSSSQPIFFQNNCPNLNPMNSARNLYPPIYQEPKIFYSPQSSKPVSRMQDSRLYVNPKHISGFNPNVMYRNIIDPTPLQYNVDPGSFSPYQNHINNGNVIFPESRKQAIEKCRPKLLQLAQLSGMNPKMF